MADENTQQTDTTTQTQTTEPASTSTDATPADAQTQTQSTGEQQNATQQQTVDNKDLGSNKNPDEKSDAAQKPSTPEVVNEKTEFTIPDGLKIDDKKMSAFKTVAKELGLTKEQAQKLVDLDANNIKNADKAFNDMKASWKADTMKMLGENAEQKLGEAAAAFKRFGDEEFVKLMQDTGLENHPAVVRVFRSIGSKIAVDKTVSATSDGVNSSMTLTEALYGKN
jgi:hypothetical protein